MKTELEPANLIEMVLKHLPNKMQSPHVKSKEETGLTMAVWHELMEGVGLTIDLEDRPTINIFDEKNHSLRVWPLCEVDGELNPDRLAACVKDVAMAILFRVVDQIQEDAMAGTKA